MESSFDEETEDIFEILNLNLILYFYMIKKFNIEFIEMGCPAFQPVSDYF